MRQFVEHLLFFQLVVSQYSPLPKVADKRQRVSLYALAFTLFFLFQTACYVYCKLFWV